MMTNTLLRSLMRHQLQCDDKIKFNFASLAFSTSCERFLYWRSLIRYQRFYLFCFWLWEKLFNSEETGIMSMFRRHNSKIVNFEDFKEDMRKFQEKISDKTKPQGTTLTHRGYPGQSSLQVTSWRWLLINQPVCLRKMILRGTQSLMLQIVEQIERNSRRRKKANMK